MTEKHWRELEYVLPAAISYLRWGSGTKKHKAYIGLKLANTLSKAYYSVRWHRQRKINNH